MSMICAVSFATAGWNVSVTEEESRIVRACRARTSSRWNPVYLCQSSDTELFFSLV